MADLFLIESLSKFKEISLPATIIEHVHKVMMVRDRKHGLAYGYMLNKVFQFLKVPSDNRAEGSSKQMFIMSILEECECIE